jgi:hypothetical protein
MDILMFDFFFTSVLAVVELMCTRDVPDSHFFGKDKSDSLHPATKMRVIVKNSPFYSRDKNMLSFFRFVLGPAGSRVGAHFRVKRVINEVAVAFVTSPPWLRSHL